MAHRALVAYRDGERFHLHYAHWGAQLATAITPTTPLGGRADRRVPPPDRLAEQLDRERGYASATRVDPRPLARDLAPTDVLAAVDDSIESLVVVEPEYETRTYHVCSLDVDGDGPLVLAGPTDAEHRLRQTLVTVKDRLGERVDGGDLDPELARRVVRHTLATQVPVHPLDDASFLSPD